MIRHALKPSFLAALAIFTAFLPLQAEARCFAVLVGNSAYDKGEGLGLANLPSAAADIRKMREWLINGRNCQPHEIKLLPNVTSRQMKHYFGDGISPQTRLAEEVAARGNVDQLDIFFYYSGHGTQDTVGGDDEDGRAAGLLVGVDAFKDRDIGPYSVPLSRVVTGLEDLGARSVTVMVDACFTGETRGTGTALSSVTSRAFRRYTPVKTEDETVRLFATNGSQLAIEDNQAGLGLFTAEFLRGVSGQADRNGDKQITLAELRDYLGGAVPSRANELNKSLAASQIPSIEGPENKIISRVHKILAPAPIFPRQARPSPSPVHRTMRLAPTPDPQGMEHALNLDEADRKWAQAALKHLGHYHKAIDADFGPGTRAAIRSLQRMQGAEQTGYLTAVQWAYLRVQDRSKVEALLRPAVAVNPAVIGKSNVPVGQTFRDCRDCPEMVWLPRGRFLQGSTDKYSDARPTRNVSINYDLAVGTKEVTFSQWDACVMAGGCSHIPHDWNWGRGNRPVINVNWSDAQRYLRWLSKRTGKTYRLLSESEWEYAARAGSIGHYYWGNSIGSRLANCKECGSRWDGSKPAPVGSFSANQWGLYDMHGNVMEWVQDCWNVTYEGAPVDGTAWMQGDCEQNVVRGGSWDLPPIIMRSSYRARYPAINRYAMGFRVAVTHNAP